MTSPQFTAFIPRNADESLALEIAEAFNDARHLATYLKVCARRNRSVVYRAYRETMAIPSHRIRKSRRAIFFFILRANERKYSTRN
jgi:hypothetical protein